MNSSNQLAQSIQQITTDHSTKVQTTSVLFLIQSTLITAFQINIVLSIIMSLLIPLAIRLHVHGSIIVIMVCIFGFMIGISFAVVLIQKYILKLIKLM